jgi:hypothetical protein
MGSGRKPGPTCSSDDAAGAIDAGTNCRAKSPEPGPIGLNADADVAEARALDDAMRAREKAPKSDEITQIMLDQDIQLVADSPFKDTAEGREIIALLKRLNKSRDIVYADTNGARGEWDGTTIRVSQDFAGKMFPTAIELVHEATHALWRQKHPAKSRNAADIRKESIDDELHAQTNQLNMYRHLRDTRNFTDRMMDLRLARLDSNKLRNGIEDGFVTD